MAKKIQAEIEIKGIGQIEDANKAAERLKKQLDGAESEARQLGRAASDARAELKKLSAAGVDKSSEQFKAAKANADKLGESLRKANLDLKDLKKSYNDAASAAKQGAKATDSLASSVGKMVGGLIGAGAAIGVFKQIISKTAELEASTLKLKAASNQVGQSFEDNQNKVKKLTETGDIAIGATANNFATLIKAGFDAQKAFDLIDAAKKLGTFASATGNAGDAVNDLVAGLLTGEEQLYNIDPTLKQVAKSLGGGEKVAGDFATKMAFVNEVIARGQALNGPYADSLNGLAATQSKLGVATNNFLTTIGQKMAPALARIGGAIASAIVLLTKFSDGLIYLIRITPGLGQVVNLFSKLSDLIGESQNEELENQVKTYGELLALAERDVATQEQKNELLKTQAALVGGLPKAYQEAFKAAAEGNKPLAEQINLLRALKKEAEADAGLSDADLAEQIKKLEFAGRIRDPLLATAGGADPDRLKALREIQRQRQARNAPAKTGGGGGPQLKSSDFLLNDLQRTLAANKAAQKEFDASIEGVNNAAKRASAELKRQALDTEAVRQASEAVSNFYRTEYENSIAAVGEASLAANDKLKQLYEEGKISAQEYADEQAKVEETKQRKILEIQLDYAERAAQSLAQVNSQAIALIQSNSASGTVGAVGGIASAGGSAFKSGGVLGGLGLAGLGGGLAIAGIGLGIGAAIFGAIEDAEEEAARKEKERQERLERLRQEAFQRELNRQKVVADMLRLNLKLEKDLALLAKERRDILNRLADLDAKTESEKLKRQQKQAAQDAASALGVTVQANKGKAGIGRGGSDIGGRTVFRSNVAGATQAELAVLAGNDDKAKAGVLADIQARNTQANAARAQLKTLIGGTKDAKDISGFAKLFDFYEKNSALLTQDERTAFEGSYSTLLAAYKRGQQGPGILLGGASLGDETGAIAQAQKDAAETAAAIDRATRETAGGFTSGNDVFSLAAEATTGQNELIQGATEALVTSAELQSQLSTQKFRDRLDAINRAASAAEATGQTFDAAGKKRGLAEQIASFLGLDVNNLDPNAGVNLSLEDKDKFDLMIDLLKETADATSETAANTSPTALGERQRTFFDVGAGQVVNADRRFSLGLEGYQLQAPSGVQSVALAAGIAAPGSFNPQLAQLNKTADDQLIELRKIASKIGSGGNGSTGKSARSEIAYLNKNKVK